MSQLLEQQSHKTTKPQNPKTPRAECEEDKCMVFSKFESKLELVSFVPSVRHHENIAMAISVDLTFQFTIINFFLIFNLALEAAPRDEVQNQATDQLGGSKESSKANLSTREPCSPHEMSAIDNHDHCDSKREDESHDCAKIQQGRCSVLDHQAGHVVEGLHEDECQE